MGPFFIFEAWEEVFEPSEQVHSEAGAAGRHN
jgi:hypothetical protein